MPHQVRHDITSKSKGAREAQHLGLSRNESEDRMMDDFDLGPILESLFFLSDSPIRLETLVEILPEWNREAILEGIRQIQVEYENRSKGIELTEIAGGYQFRTKPGFAVWVNRLKKSKTVKLSQAALETLAIVAYRQPIIRPAIEEVRGVDSGSVLHTLLEKGLVKIMGRKDLPGRPLVYGTTRTFLELFSLNTLSDLPSLQEIQPSPAPSERSLEEIIPQEIAKGEISENSSSNGDSVTMSLQGSETTEAISQGVENNEMGTLSSFARNDEEEVSTQSRGEEEWGRAERKE
jgi:segregation and condensation protein B